MRGIGVSRPLRRRALRPDSRPQAARLSRTQCKWAVRARRRRCRPAVHASRRGPSGLIRKTLHTEEIDADRRLLRGARPLLLPSCPASSGASGSCIFGSRPRGTIKRAKFNSAAEYEFAARLTGASRAHSSAGRALRMAAKRPSVRARLGPSPSTTRCPARRASPAGQSRRCSTPIASSRSSGLIMWLWSSSLRSISTHFTYRAEPSCFAH